MKFHCKCGFCLTGDLSKTHSKDGYTVTKTDNYGTDENPLYVDSYEVTKGTYHKFTKHIRMFKNTFRVNISDLVEGVIQNACKGCCDWDYFEVICPNCKSEIGSGGIDCWQTKHVDLRCHKVRIKTN